MAGPAIDLQVGDRTVRLSNPDRVYFPARGETKLDLARYYAGVAATMTPHLRDRPLNLWRWNQGIDGQRVVQQEIPKGAPDWVRRGAVAKRGGGTVRHIIGGEAATLVWMANQNCITPHVWSARCDRPDRPDRLIFDLDPPGAEAFHVVREAALALGELLRGHGFTPFALLTGSKGVHVVAPLRRSATADVVRARAGELGQELADRDPERLTTAWRKEKRGGRVLVDTARNTYAQTVVAPYAVRALPGAPVAAPLTWEELEDPQLHAQRWTLRTLAARLDDVGDPWAEIARHAASCP